MTALTVCGVLAPEWSVLLSANAGGTAEGLPFVPNDGMMGFFYFHFPKYSNISVTF